MRIASKAIRADTLPLRSATSLCMLLSGFFAMDSLVIRIRPVAEENTSKQPFLPQVHWGPSTEITVCPISAPAKLEPA